MFNNKGDALFDAFRQYFFKKGILASWTQLLYLMLNTELISFCLWIAKQMSLDNVL